MMINGAELFGKMHPGFFEQEHIRNIPKGTEYEEMVLFLGDDYDGQFEISEPEGVSFGYYTGTHDQLLKAVAEVDSGWPQFFGSVDRVYCALADGEIASFCIVEDMGLHECNGRTWKIGGPGCVGTVPKYRRRGIGLAMVRNVTRIFKEQGYDLSYIHYTGVGSWYAKLGYETILRWNRDGLLPVGIRSSKDSIEPEVR